MNLFIAQAQILNNLLSLITIFWQLSIWRKKIKQTLQQHGKWFVGPAIKTLHVIQMHDGYQFAKILTTFITRLISISKQFHKLKCIFIRTFCGLLHNRDFFHWPRRHILYGQHVMQHVTKIDILYRVFLDIIIRNFRRSLCKKINILQNNDLFSCFIFLLDRWVYLGGLIFIGLLNLKISWLKYKGSVNQCPKGIGLGTIFRNILLGEW